MPVYLLGALISLAAIAVFVFQNTSVVTIRFINWISPEVSLAVVILIAACAGALITFLVDSFRYFKAAKKAREIIADNRQLQSEINKLKGEKTVRKNKDSKKTIDSQSTEQNSDHNDTE